MLNIKEKKEEQERVTPWKRKKKRGATLWERKIRLDSRASAAVKPKKKKKNLNPAAVDSRRKRRPRRID